MHHYLKSKVSSTTQLALVLLCFTIGLVSFFAYESYHNAVDAYSKQAKEKLQTAVTLLIPYHDKWHDRFASENKPTKEEYNALLLNQSLLAKEIHVRYIYSFTYTKEPKFYFSSGSATDEDLKDPHLITTLNQEYENTSEYLTKVALTETPQFGQAHDQWGHHFSYMLPRVSPKGVAYILGVDLSVDTIKEDAMDIFWYWLVIGSFVSTIGFIFAFFAIKPIMRELNEKNSALELQTQNLQIANNQLEYLAKKDSLTGINNRREFFNLVTDIWDRHENIFCVMLDLDNFKTVNDTFGHTLGDVALIEFTKTVNVHINTNTIFGRLGGEEFALVMYDTSYKNVLSILESIKDAIQNLHIKTEDGKIHFTVSMGIAKKEYESSIDVCLDQADHMLYDAKQSGRNKIKVRLNPSKDT